MLKLDIENKILLPILVLIIVPIITIGSISYINAEKLFIEREQKYMDSLLIYYEELYYDEMLKKRSMVIEDYVLVYSSVKPTTDHSSHAVSDESIMSYSKVDDGYLILEYNNVSMQNELFQFQKNSILVAIVAMIVSTQIIVILANYISKPLIRMSETCKNIQSGSFEKMPDIKREDELGILSNSFNNMIDTITENTEKIEMLKELNQKVVENAPIALVRIDLNGSTQSYNKIGRKYINVKMLEKESKLSFDDFIKTKMDDQVYEFFDNETSNRVYIDISRTFIDDLGTIISLNDITKRREMELKMDQVNKLSSLGRVAASLAHEIRNPLTGVRAGIQILYKRYNKDNASEEIYESLVGEIDRLNGLINEILNFSKPTQSLKTTCDVTYVLNSSLELLRDEMVKNNVDVQIDVEADQIFCHLDPNQLKQIFLNIISNGFNAMDKDTKVLKINIKNTIDSFNKRYLMISVADNGKGMKEEEMEHIFDPFYTTSKNGTGLGLSVVHKLMTENNGIIRYQSEKGVGTEVILIFEVLVNE